MLIIVFLIVTLSALFIYFLNKKSKRGALPPEEVIIEPEVDSTVINETEEDSFVETVIHEPNSRQQRKDRRKVKRSYQQCRQRKTWHDRFGDEDYCQ